MEESFDILDVKGQHTGETAPRSVCHEKGLYHKAVALFIINSKDQVLLQKRSASKKLWPNMWDISAGGHVLAGEFGFEAIIRECEEELGLKLRPEETTFIGATISNTERHGIIHNHFNEYYIARKDLDPATLTLQTEEVSDAKWIDRDEIIARIGKQYQGVTDKEGCWEYLIEYYKHQET